MVHVVACGARHLCLFLMYFLAATWSCILQPSSRIVVFTHVAKPSALARPTNIKSEISSVIFSISPIIVMCLRICLRTCHLCLYTPMPLTMACGNLRRRGRLLSSPCSFVISSISIAPNYALTATKRRSNHVSFPAQRPPHKYGFAFSILHGFALFSVSSFISSMFLH